MTTFITLFIPLVGTSLGSAMVFLLKDKISPKTEKSLLGFAAGVMIAASVWSLLIPSINMAETQGIISWLPAAVGFLCGIGFLLLLDELIPHLHLGSNKPEGLPSKLPKCTMMLFAVMLHNIPEGMTTGVALAGSASKDAGISGDTVRRYIRLTELSPELQQMVDEKKIGMTPAVEISYLKPEEQQMLLTAIDSEQATPSLSQAQRMKKLSRDGKLNDDTMLDIMMEQKKPEGYNVVLSADKLRKYFPRSYTPQKMEETILKLLDAWLRKRQRDQSR